MGAYQLAVSNRNRPSVLALSRQAMPNQAHSSANQMARGGSIPKDSDDAPCLILISTGTGTCTGPELDLCVKAAVQVPGEGHQVRVGVNALRRTF